MSQTTALTPAPPQEAEANGAPAKNKPGPKPGSRNRRSPAQIAAGKRTREMRGIVDRYLRALKKDITAPRWTRTTEMRLAKIAELVADPEIAPVERLLLFAERDRIMGRDAMPPEDREVLRQEFIKVAKEYGEQQGISYGVWRSCGVPAADLKAAGVKSR